MSGIIRQLDHGDERPGKRLRIQLHEVVEAQIADGHKWLVSSPFGGVIVAERWVDGLMDFVEKEADLQGTLPFDRPLDPESPPERVWYRQSYSISRRSTPWYVFFELLDEDNDGIIDTLHVVRIRHSAREGS